MFQILDSIKEIIMCTIILMMLRPTTGREFVIIPSEEHEILVPSLNSKYRDVYKEANTKPHYAVIRSEGYEVFPTRKTEQQYPNHSIIWFNMSRPPSDFLQEDELKIVGNTYQEGLHSPMINNNGTNEKDNNTLRVSSKPVLDDSGDYSDISINVSSINNNTTINKINVIDDKDVSVDDRASFDGDQCPKGQIKIQGKCVPPD